MLVCWVFLFLLRGLPFRHLSYIVALWSLSLAARKEPVCEFKRSSHVFQSSELHRVTSREMTRLQKKTSGGWMALSSICMRGRIPN